MPASARRFPLALVASAALAYAPAIATSSTLVVPDDSGTIQAALDAQPDTILVRPGTYPERLSVARSVTLMGLASTPNALPLVDGIDFIPTATGTFAAPYTFRFLRIRSDLTIVNDVEPAHISISYCIIDGGITDRSRYLETRHVTLDHATIYGDAAFDLSGVCAIDSCFFYGQLVIGGVSANVTMTASVVSGPRSGFGLYTGTINSLTITRSRIFGFDSGIESAADSYTSIAECVIEDCPGVAIESGPHAAYMYNNVIRRCGLGIRAGSDLMIVSGNTITGCGTGMLVGAGGRATIMNNVVWRCFGDGIRAAMIVSDSVVIRNNTLALNGGSGFVSETDVTRSGFYQVTNNIGFGNGEYGVHWITVEVSRVSCNDWFQNALGDVWGAPASDDDEFVDPMFCDGDAGNVNLSPESPLRDWPGCGLVGALAGACYSTAARTSAPHVSYSGSAVVIVWGADVGTDVAGEVWVERADYESGPWARLDGDRFREKDGYLSLEDRSVTRGRLYWYRVGWADGRSDAVRIWIANEAVDLVVAPNPAHGLVTFRWTQAVAGSAECGVYDLSGREIAIIRRGHFDAGVQRVTWNEGEEGRNRAAAGWYFVRVRGKGVDAARRFLLLR